MKHCDWRSLGRETQETIRKIAVRAVDENNESPADVIRILGITRSRLYDWLARYNNLHFAPSGGSFSHFIYAMQSLSVSHCAWQITTSDPLVSHISTEVLSIGVAGERAAG